jgi:hypothetical protein
VYINHSSQVSSREIAVNSNALTPGKVQTQLHPRLIAGETSQAFLSAAYRPPSKQSRPFVNQSFNNAQLRSSLCVQSDQLILRMHLSYSPIRSVHRGV